MRQNPSRLTPDDLLLCLRVRRDDYLMQQFAGSCFEAVTLPDTFVELQHLSQIADVLSDNRFYFISVGNGGQRNKTKSDYSLQGSSCIHVDRDIVVVHSGIVRGSKAGPNHPRWSL